MKKQTPKQKKQQDKKQLHEDPPPFKPKQFSASMKKILRGSREDLPKDKP